MTKKLLTTLYIIRHGESENNIKDIVGSNPDLTPKGIAQAETMAKKLSKVNIDAVYSSDLIRASKTAQIIATHFKLKVSTSKKLRERNYGIYEGVSFEKFKNEMKEILQKMATMSDESLKSFRRYKSFETDNELMKRFYSFLKELNSKYGEKTILIVSHGLVIRTFLIYIGFATYKELPTFAIPNTGYIKIVSDGTNFRLKRVYGIHKCPK